MTSPQFFVSVTLPDAENKCTRQASFTIGAKGTVLLNQVVAKGDYQRDFHAFILKIDKKKNQAQLFEKKNNKLLSTCPLKKCSDKVETLVLFGDGSTATFGSVDLSYIGWKY